MSRSAAFTAAAWLALAAVPAVRASDDGSQLRSPFRIDYLGYLQAGPKVALFLAPQGGSLAWTVEDASGAAVARGTTSDYVANDFASGDSFFRIDFSTFHGTGKGLRLAANGQRSEPFDVDGRNPYGRLAEEGFHYFEVHRTEDTVFEKFLDNWTSGRIEGPFWKDAGDNGSYPTNTAIAVWTLLNLYERYPEANTGLGPVSIYDEVKVGTVLMHQLILPGQKLAIAKLHTNVPPYGPCPPHSSGPCVSMTETKATYAMARSLAQLARAHLREKQPAEAKRAFALARAAYTNARTEPPVCRGFESFGGEGGIYPDNDPWALWRETGKHREPCHPGRDNIEDDSFAALVEVFLAAQALGDPQASALARDVVAHPRFAEISEFWWYATAATGNLSLLTLRPAGIDLAPIRRNLFRYADELVGYEKVGYPGVTKDVHSQRWNTGDRDELDQNWRWGSNRNLLDDAILLAFAAEEKAGDHQPTQAAAYAAAAVRVLDYILGTNAMALCMVTGFGENAVERLHDCCVPNSVPGQMALGPNNWTNAGDPDMPPFGSLPGMKMMPVKGRGWGARELAIDGNAPLVWVAWWAQHRAADLLGPAK
ncbi:MAG TPA: glycoside hydrolase family 9 protein [Vicinamibacteria bacterium]|nr:glycoside hydrolase family 9 protein [Vicinamibacteria bacterium]